MAGCISLVSSDIVVNAQPATPSNQSIGTVTQPTCSTATGSFRLQAILHPIPILSHRVAYLVQD
jgi:hypothetical protein